MSQARFVVVFALLSSGCVIIRGRTLQSFGPAQGPQGVRVEVRTGAEEVIHGEVLEVGEDGIVVLSEERGRPSRNELVLRRGRNVILLPYGVIKAASFADTRHRIDNGRRPEAPVLERLRLLSRFPEGLRPDLLSELLTACGQAEIERIGGRILQSPGPAQGPKGVRVEVRTGADAVRDRITGTPPRPTGVRVEVRTGAEVIHGEVLEVGEDGIVVLSEERGGPSRDELVLRRRRNVVLLPYGVITAASFADTQDRIENGRRPEAPALERLRLLSRFPHGLPSGRLSELLTACGQAEIERIEQ